VINATRGGVYVEPHWYSDRDVAMGALNWWGRVYPGEALTLERRSGAGRCSAQTGCERRLRRREGMSTINDHKGEHP